MKMPPPPPTPTPTSLYAWLPSCIKHMIRSYLQVQLGFLWGKWDVKVTAKHLQGRLFLVLFRLSVPISLTHAELLCLQHLTSDQMFPQHAISFSCMWFFLCTLGFHWLPWNVFKLCNYSHKKEEILVLRGLQAPPSWGPLWKKTKLQIENDTQK